MKRHNTYNLCIDHQHFTKKPSNIPLPTLLWNKPDTEILQITRRISSTAQYITLDELSQAVENGQTICPYIHSIPKGWNKPSRREEFFQSMNAIIMDFDSNVEDIEVIINKIRTINLDFSLIHKSFSYTPQTPKYRGIILLNQPIIDATIAKATNLFIKEYFQGQSDPACSDLSRIFFGGGKNSVIYKSLYTCNENDLKHLYEPYLTSVKSKFKSNSAHYNEYVYDKDSCTSLQTMQDNFSQITKDTRDLIIYKINIELDSIRTYSGKYSNRYMVLFNAARILAQIPILPGNLIHQWLIEAVNKNRYYSDYDKDVNYIINSGIIFGKENESREIMI